VLFSSEGEAAMAEKAFLTGSFGLTDTMAISGLRASDTSNDDQVIFLVEPTNRNGDPVTLEVRARAAHHARSYRKANAAARGAH
jgi:hypothetical protein